MPTLSALEASHARAVLQEQLLACACLNSFLFLKDLAFVCLSGRLGAKACGRGFGARICVYACSVAVGRPQAFPRVSGARLGERGRHLAQTSLAVHNAEVGSASSVGWIATSATGVGGPSPRSACEVCEALLVGDVDLARGRLLSLLGSVSGGVASARVVGLE